jgi:uroporphyrinogen-III synthase/uroporphyrinogen III methyltransferase/synthase
VTAAALLHGRSIAITRPEPGELAAQLAALGATVLHVPLIATLEPADGGEALAAALARLAHFDWLVVTSVNGARAVGAAAAAAPGVRLAAVGPATATVLAELAGRPVDLVPVAARAEGLLEELPHGPARVLLAHADQARPVLAAGLAAAGHDVEAVVAYRTVERPPSDAEVAELAVADAVVLASGSAARAYAAAVGTRVGGEPPVVVCIGPVTADAARAAGLRVDHVADHPDPTTLTTLLTTALVAPAFSGVTSGPKPPGESTSA